MAPDRPPLREEASHETLASMHLVDPAPIESPFTVDVDGDDYLPRTHESSTSEEKRSTGMSGSSASMGLSGSSRSHGSVYYLTRIQKFSSYLIPVFASIHLANTSLVPLLARSVPASETYLLQSRELYQTTLTEPLLVAAPIAAHVFSGIALRLVRRSQNERRYGGAAPGLRVWPTLSNISVAGYALAGLLVAHVGMNRVLPLLVEGDSSSIGLGYVSHGFARHGVVSWLAYAGLIGIGCGHMVWGAARWAGWATPAELGLWTEADRRPVDRKTRKKRRRTWWAIQGVAVATAALWAAGGIVVARGGRAEGWIGKVYDGIYDTLPF